jgi:hypothetical protein
MGARWRVIALTAAAFALVSGCTRSNAEDGGGVASLGSSSASATPGGDAQSGDGKTDEDKARDFAKCMREHGVNMPDPEVDDQGRMKIQINGDNGLTEEQMKKADEECRHLMPNGGKPQQLDAEALDRMREHAKCLREHGLDVPDPDPNNPGIQIRADESNKEKVDAAMKACESLMPGGGERSTNGGGDSGGLEPTR